MNGKWMVLAAPAMLMAAPMTSPLAGQDVDFSGQIRPRFEFRDPVAGSGDAFTSMRVRANLLATLDRRVTVFIQMQDVRVWGEETNTLTDFSADNLDLHQGYIEIQPFDDANVSARVGRQEVAFGGQRLVGPVGWTQQGRSFDGVNLQAESGSFTINVFGFTLADATAAGTDNASFGGAYIEVDSVGPGTLDLYGLYDRVNGIDDTDEVTLGARWHGRQANISYRLEGSFQLGTRDDADVAAFMLGGRVGTSVADGRGQVTLWYDYLSGDDDADGNVEVFNTLYATNHKFYGFADLFLNIPAQTGGLGLQDAAIKGAYRARDDLSVNVDLHTFRLAKEGTLTTKHLAEEIDITANYRYTANVGVTGGLSWVLAGDGLAQLGRLSENLIFTYLMLNTTF